LANATPAEIINAQVQPEWLRIAVTIAATFPFEASPRHRMRLLFYGLFLKLGITDGVVLGAIHARLSAAGAIGTALTGLDIAADSAKGRALRHVIATAPLRAKGSYFSFDRQEFARLLRRCDQSNRRE